MKPPAVPNSSRSWLTRVVCVGLALAGILLCQGSVLAQAQAPQKIILRSDRKKPLRAPEKAAAQKPGGNAGAKSRTTNAASQATQAEPQTAAASSSGCFYNDILVLDTIRIVFVDLFNFPPNSAIPVTVTQTNAGVVGYALTPAGPFAPTLNTVVNTDANGDGESVAIYTQGQIVGTTTTYGDTPYGPTTTIDFNVLPQCNCPPIPVVP